MFSVNAISNPHHLIWLQCNQAHLARHGVDAARLRKLRLGQPQLPVLLTQRLDLLLFGLDAVAHLDGAEMLQAIEHHQRKQDSHGRGEDAHLADAHRVGRLDQTGVVDALGEEDFERGATAQALLLGKEPRVALVDTPGRTASAVEISCCMRCHLRSLYFRSRGFLALDCIGFFFSAFSR